jgi:hypothetical protein
MASAMKPTVYIEQNRVTEEQVANLFKAYKTGDKDKTDQEFEKIISDVKAAGLETDRAAARAEGKEVESVEMELMRKTRALLEKHSMRKANELEAKEAQIMAKAAEEAEAAESQLLIDKITQAHQVKLDTARTHVATAATLDNTPIWNVTARMAAGAAKEAAATAAAAAEEEAEVVAAATAAEVKKAVDDAAREMDETITMVDATIALHNRGTKTREFIYAAAKLKIAIKLAERAVVLAKAMMEVDGKISVEPNSATANEEQARRAIEILRRGLEKQSNITKVHPTRLKLPPRGGKKTQKKRRIRRKI